jgi:hypothetical protein
MASGKSLSLNNQVLKQLFLQVTPSWTANTRVYVSLHTGNLTDASNQTTFEATYTGYARVGVLRDASHWTINEATGEITNALAVTFPSSSSSQTVTYVAIGSAASGAGQIYYWGTIESGGLISSGETPVFAAGDLSIMET